MSSDGHSHREVRTSPRLPIAKVTTMQMTLLEAAAILAIGVVTMQLQSSDRPSAPLRPYLSAAGERVPTTAAAVASRTAEMATIAPD